MATTPPNLPSSSTSSSKPDAATKWACSACNAGPTGAILWIKHKLKEFLIEKELTCPYCTVTMLDEIDPDSALDQLLHRRRVAADEEGDALMVAADRMLYLRRQQARKMKERVRI
ncbi:uncharacterized protein BDZ99DRAFT_531149 [Mytilinidion resinicola]|uniref:Uncharacterized protein n=1 Tax=Mytilinidion resinicola TaxID=574789 RepID=A0A6A6Z9W9_9PEZI|nr:uncharacterized protein BDZ99DRAFT_531149 [Mytilinidion resinicola]KAF2817922.1 hypothetical protein BDZ99DRAFT_531149 [Mytilinidion resinicola]